MNNQTENENKSSIQKWKEYVETLNWGPGNRDDSAYNAALRAASLDLEPQVAADYITSKITNSGGTYEMDKLQSQIRRAYQWIGEDGDHNIAIINAPKAAFEKEKAASLITGMSMVTNAWLQQQSPIDPSNVTAGAFLEKLYEPGEKIVVFNDYRSQGQLLYEVGSQNNDSVPNGKQDGVWFLVNPVDGAYHANPRQQNKQSRRSEESITSWRYLVVESDLVEPADWIKVLVQLPLNISAIYSSGGKSIHALVRIDASSKYEWNMQRDQIRPILVTIGADPNAMTAVRLSRLPGCKRGEQDQQLYYLNPNPTAEPIFKSK